MRNRTPRRASEEAEYAALRRKVLKLDEPEMIVYCEVGPKLAAHGVRRCTIIATELNHRRKRSSSGALANPENVEPCCHGCNMAVEDYPEHALAAGVVIREGDPEWESLSSRAWRKGR